MKDAQKVPCFPLVQVLVQTPLLRPRGIEFLTSTPLEALIIEIEETQRELKGAQEELKSWEGERRAFFEKEARLYHQRLRSAEVYREYQALLTRRDLWEAELTRLKELLGNRASE